MYTQTGKTAAIDPADYERIIVMGDIHGDLDSFKTGVSIRKPSDLLVFLGDYSDRGPYGVEVIQGIMSLKARFPANFLPLKGNHEDYSADGDPLFYPCTLIDEVESKGRSWQAFFADYKSFVDDLPLSAVITGYALLAHAGLSPDIESIADLEKPPELVEKQLIWSDPSERPGVSPSPRGAGALFGPDVSEKVLGRLGLTHLYRSHQPRKAAGGPFIEHDTRLITTSATDIYGGRPFAVVLHTAALPDTEDEIVSSTVFLT